MWADSRLNYIYKRRSLTHNTLYYIWPGSNTADRGCTRYYLFSTRWRRQKNIASKLIIIVIVIKTFLCRARASILHIAELLIPSAVHNIGMCALRINNISFLNFFSIQSVVEFHLSTRLRRQYISRVHNVYLDHEPTLCGFIYASCVQEKILRRVNNRTIIL